MIRRRRARPPGATPTAPGNAPEQPEATYQALREMRTRIIERFDQVVPKRPPRSSRCELCDDTGRVHRLVELDSFGVLRTVPLLCMGTGGSGSCGNTENAARRRLVRDALDLVDASTGEAWVERKLLIRRSTAGAPPGAILASDAQVCAARNWARLVKRASRGKFVALDRLADALRSADWKLLPTEAELRALVEGPSNKPPPGQIALNRTHGQNGRPTGQTAGPEPGDTWGLHTDNDLDDLEAIE